MKIKELTKYLLNASNRHEWVLNDHEKRLRKLEREKFNFKSLAKDELVNEIYEIIESYAYNIADGAGGLLVIDEDVFEKVADDIAKEVIKLLEA